MIRPPTLVSQPIGIAVLIACFFFTDLYTQDLPNERTLTLDDVIRMALDHHPDIQAGRAFVEAANASVGELTSKRLPQVAFNATATRYQEPMIVQPLHAFDPTRAPEFNRTLLTGSARISYDLFDGGVRGGRIDRARSDASATESHFESTVAILLAEVASTYLNVLTNHEIIQAHDQQMEALEAERERVALMFQEGTVAEVDLLRVDAAIANASAERIVAATELEIAEFALSRLIGVTPELTQASRLVATSLRDTFALDDRAALLAVALDNNPDILSASRNFEASNAAHKTASAMWLPKLYLFGGYLGFSSAAGGLTTEWQAGAGISYPIFTGGGRSAAISRANALSTAASEQLRSVELGVQTGLDRAISANRGAFAREAAAVQAVEHLSEVTRIERLALEAGAGTQAEYLRAQSDLLRARATLVQASYGKILASIELARVLGVLSPAWLDRVLETER